MLSRDDAAPATVPPLAALMAVATTPRRKARHPKAGGSWKIRWDDAFAWYAADPTRTAGDVAERFSVSERAVRNHMKAERWPERRRAMLDAARLSTDARVLRSLEERRERTVRVAEKARDAVLAEAAVLDPDVALRALPRYAQLEELFEGGPTERVEQLHRVLVILPQLLGDVLSGLLPLIPLGEHERAVQVFEGTVGRYSEQLALPAENADGNTEA